MFLFSVLIRRNSVRRILYDGVGRESPVYREAPE